MSDEFFKITFAKNLNYYLELNSKNQADLVNDLGFNKATVSTWCNGKKIPRMDKIDQLCSYFHIKRSDLIEDIEITDSLCKSPAVDYAQQLIDMGVTDEDFEKIKKYYYAIIKDEK